MQSLLDQIAQLSDRQSTAIDDMAARLFTADRLPMDALRVPVVDWVKQCADSIGKPVRVTFTGLPVTGRPAAGRSTTSIKGQVQREILDAMIAPLKALLHSIVTETIERQMLQQVKHKPEQATIDIHCRQLQSVLTIEVSDNGCGVVVQGVESGANDPWNTGCFGDQVSNPKTQMPQVSSKLTGNTINLKPLIEFVSNYGGTVAVGSDDEGSVYRFTLPIKENLQEVVLIEAGESLFALPASRVAQVSDMYSSTGSDEGVVSLAQLMGMSSVGTFNKFMPGQGSNQGANQGTNNGSPVASRLRCATRSGSRDLLVDRIVGHRSMVFSSSHQLMPDLKGYLGASVVRQHQIVLLLNLDYWL